MATTNAIALQPHTRIATSIAASVPRSRRRWNRASMLALDAGKDRSPGAVEWRESQLPDDILPGRAQDPVEERGDVSIRRDSGIDVERTDQRIRRAGDGVFSWADGRGAAAIRQPQGLDAAGGEGDSAVAERARRARDERDHIFRSTLIDRAHPVLAIGAEHDLTEVRECSGVVLAADADDAVAGAAGMIETELRPAHDPAAVAVDVRELCHRDGVERILPVDEYGERIARHHQLGGLGPILHSGTLALGGPDLAARGREIQCAVDQPGNADTGSAAGDLDDCLRTYALVLLGP